MAGLWPAGWAPLAAGSAPSAIPAPLILTVALPDALQRQADAVRGAHAPEAAARAPAHLALFRHLPGLGLDTLVSTMRRALAAPAPTFWLRPPHAWGGRWIAPVEAPALDALRAGLADSWHGLLAPGDHAPPRLHISLSSGRRAPPQLPEGPWRARGLLLWQHGATHHPIAERGGSNTAAERGGPFWTPLVALAFHG